MNSPRIIRLRRPPTLSPIEEPFVPHRCSLDEIDDRWAQLQRRNPAYYDGRLWHVSGVHRNGHGGATLHVMQCAYRFFAVQSAELDLGCRPLGVKAFTTRGDCVLAGRRSSSVAGYSDCWEFAPGGSVDPGTPPAEMIISELVEETSLHSLNPPIPLVLLFDPQVRTWEIVYRLDVGPAADPQPSPEYTELRWVNPHNLPRPRSGIARAMIPLARDLNL